jgi:hypothetical protein
MNEKMFNELLKRVKLEENSSVLRRPISFKAIEISPTEIDVSYTIAPEDLPRDLRRTFLRYLSIFPPHITGMPHISILQNEETGTDYYIELFRRKIVVGRVISKGCEGEIILPCPERALCALENMVNEYECWRRGERQD